MPVIRPCHPSLAGRRWAVGPARRFPTPALASTAGEPASPRASRSIVVARRLGTRNREAKNRKTKDRKTKDRQRRSSVGGMGFLEVDGAALAYDVEGRGDHTLAFAHGWCSMRQHWDAQTAHFRDRYRVVRWDRRGMGASRTASPADSPARHADDLAAILDAEGIDRVTVVGHAGGGPTALTFADRHAGRTDALVMVDTRLHGETSPGAGSPGAGPSGGSSPGVSPTGEDAFASSVGHSCDRLLADDQAFFDKLYRSFFGPRAAPVLIDAAVANALATPPEIAVADMRHILLDTVAIARRVTCPVLWVSARPDDTSLVRRSFSDVSIGHVIGSGHFVQVEVPQQLNAMMDTFLDACLPSKRAS
jgi:pimeloyl-ACP methyl ester carboxylesterase